MAPRKHNSQTPRDRQKLVNDFERRLRYDLQQGDRRHWLQRPRSLAWVVHPLADEAGLLAELWLKPDRCIRADAYWRYGESVYFVQFFSSTPPTVYRDGEPAGPAPPYSCRPGVYYRFDKDLRQDDFDVFLPGPVVTSAGLHHAFQILEEIIDAGRIEVERTGLQNGDGRWIGREDLIAELI